jgi:hypothetical protein
MDEIASLCACEMLSLRAPAHFANAGQHVGYRVLLSMMMNSGPRSRFDFEKTSPDCRSDAQ